MFTHKVFSIVIGLCLCAAACTALPEVDQGTGGPTRELPTKAPTHTIVLAHAPTSMPTPLPTSTPTETASPAPSLTPFSLTITPTPVQNDGIYQPVEFIRLTYDPARWIKGYYQVTPETVSWVKNLLLSLSHVTIPDCWIGANLGRGLPDYVEIRKTTEILGEHTYAVMEFYDKDNASQLPFAVYDLEIAVEFPYERERCLADIRQVLSTYATP